MIETQTSPKPRLEWDAIVRQAAAIVRGYDTSVTLRQLYFRLVAAGTLPNSTTAYKTLSSVTAEARRRGTFPALIDRTRTIHRYETFSGAADARAWLASIYRRDRTEDQAVSLYLGVEKNGIVEQLQAWFGALGLPVLALGGYSSQSYVEEVRAEIEGQDRPAALIYAGEFDASGEDIDRDFRARVGGFVEVVRVALDAAQVEAYDLPPQPGKATDPRAGAFVTRHGELVQVELDALAPEVLRGLYAEAIGRYWDTSAYRQSVEREERDRGELARTNP